MAELNELPNSQQERTIARGASRRALSPLSCQSRYADEMGSSRSRARATIARTPTRLLSLAVLVTSVVACGGGDSLDDEVRAQFKDVQHVLIARGNELGREWQIHAFDDNGAPGILRFGPFGGGSRFGGFSDSSGLDFSRSDGKVRLNGVEYSVDVIDGFGPPGMAAVRLKLKDGTVYRAPAIRSQRFEDVTFFVITGPGLASLEFESIKALGGPRQSL